MRALVLVLDSVGIGGAPDAASYGDEGANTLGHILEKVPELRLPHLESLGLGELVGRDSVEPRTNSPRRLDGVSPYQSSYGKMQERSAGKDTTTGHWEIAGVILEEPFATFERFPDDLVRAIERDAGVQFIGNYAQSGTTILAELGAEHVRTGKPILYTSADSVLQIAAHEQVIRIDRLYDICTVTRQHADRFRIGRVIARPFSGPEGNFSRTSRRHDFSMQPPRTILNAISESGHAVIGVGKIRKTRQCLLPTLRKPKHLIQVNVIERSGHGDRKISVLTVPNELRHDEIFRRENRLLTGPPHSGSFGNVFATSFRARSRSISSGNNCAHSSAAFGSRKAH